MDFSRLKLEVYDFLGLVLPGLIAICEGWILLRGWHAFLGAINQIGGTGFTLLLLLAFGVGNVVQELADVTVKAIKGQRYFRSARDRFWLTADAEIVKNTIKKELGHQVTSVDAAFDYCLTKLGDRFGKRDIFLATSDLCRSFVVLAILAIFPLIRVVSAISHSRLEFVLILAASFSVILVVCYLSWVRMVRFRGLAELTVFRIYAASRERSKLREPNFE